MFQYCTVSFGFWKICSINTFFYVQHCYKCSSSSRYLSAFHDLRFENPCCSWKDLHLTLLAPLERAGFDSYAGRTLVAAATRQHVVRPPDQLGSRVDPVANQPHGRIRCDATALRGFSSLLLLLLVVPQDDAHVGVPRKVVIRRVHNGAIVRQTDVHLFELFAEQGQRRGRLILAR